MADPAEEPVAFGLLMLMGGEPWFVDAMTRAEQAAAALEEKGIVGRMALSRGLMQIGLTKPEEKRQMRDAPPMSSWLCGESEACLRLGAKLPFDWAGYRRPTGQMPPPADDWAHGAARGAMTALCEDRALQNVLERLPDHQRRNLTMKLAAIIRIADAMRRDLSDRITVDHHAEEPTNDQR